MQRIQRYFHGPVNANQPEKVLRLDTTEVAYVERFDGRGLTHVAVHVRREVESGGRVLSQEMSFDDLDAAEAVVGHSSDFATRATYKGTFDPKSPDERVQFGGLMAGLWGYVRQDGKPEVVIHLSRDEDAAGPPQGLQLYASRLKQIVEEGRKVEKELREQERSYVVVQAREAGDGPDTAKGRIVQRFATLQEAELFAYGKNPTSDLIAWPCPLRNDGGDWISLHRGMSRVADREISNVHFDQGRETEHFLLAKWSDTSGGPVPGTVVTYEYGGRAYNKEARDFEAHRSRPPQSGIEPPRGEAMYLVLEKDEYHPFRGIIRGVYPGDKGRDVAVTELRRREHEHGMRIAQNIEQGPATGRTIPIEIAM